MILCIAATAHFEIPGDNQVITGEQCPTVIKNGFWNQAIAPPRLMPKALTIWSCCSWWSTFDLTGDCRMKLGIYMGMDPNSKPIIPIYTDDTDTNHHTGLSGDIHWLRFWCSTGWISSFDTYPDAAQQITSLTAVPNPKRILFWPRSASSPVASLNRNVLSSARRFLRRCGKPQLLRERARHSEWFKNAPLGGGWFTKCRSMLGTGLI